MLTRSIGLLCVVGTLGAQACAVDRKASLEDSIRAACDSPSHRQPCANSPMIYTEPWRNRCRMSGSDQRGREVIEGCVLSGMDLRGTVFKDIVLRAVKLDDACLRGAIFQNVGFETVDL